MSLAKINFYRLSTNLLPTRLFGRFFYGLLRCLFIFTVLLEFGSNLRGERSDVSTGSRTTSSFLTSLFVGEFLDEVVFCGDELQQRFKSFIMML